MTTTLFYYASKRVYHMIAPFWENKKVELSFDIAALEGLLNQGNTLTCTCCGWEGEEKKAKKHYLFIGKIAEVELFCPKCHHYLGFISDWV